MMQSVEDPPDVYKFESKFANLPSLIDRLSQLSTSMTAHATSIQTYYDQLSTASIAHVDSKGANWPPTWTQFCALFPKTASLAPPQLQTVQTTVQQAFLDGVLVLLFSLDEKDQQTNTELLFMQENLTRRAGLRFVLKLVGIPVH